ncbi:MAG: sigma-70 family RNA polymerase sigma factor [Cyanobacteria bacterium MAG APA_bin_95]|nr:sigma-70 family RNA polymerase sigma factor [Cyanobacteria bacterium MAG APA_bin_95]
MPSPKTGDVVTETRQLFTVLILSRRQNCDTSYIRNRIVQMNSRLAQQVASRMIHRCSLDFDDLVQIGHLGLIKAVERFDPNTGYAFSSFAVPLIRGEILHYLRDHVSPIRVSRRLLELHSRGIKLQETMANRSGRYPTESELCAALEVTPVRWQQACQAKRTLRLSSLDQRVLGPDDEGESPRLVDLLSAQLKEDDNSELYAHMYYFIGRLGADAQRLLKWRVCDGLSHRELAQREGVSMRVISRRLHGILQQLQHQLGPMVTEHPYPRPARRRCNSVPAHPHRSAHGQ